MPIPNIKGIRGFTRRKSGGNDLDTGKPTDSPLPALPASSGFRVIPREEAGRRSIGAGALLDGRPVKDFSAKRQISGDDWASNRLDLVERAGAKPKSQILHARQAQEFSRKLYKSLQGSNSTASSGAPIIFDSLGEHGFSSSSTLQSPVEAVKKDSPQSKASPFLNLSADFDDDLSNIFAGLADPRRSRLLEDEVITKPAIPVFARSDSEPALSHLSRSSPVQRAAATPPPPPPHMMLKDHYASPYSHKSQNSRDLLMSSPNVGGYSPPKGNESPLPTPPPKDEGHMLFPQARTTLAVPKLPFLQRTTSNESFTRSGATEDADALLVRDSFKQARSPFGAELPKSKSRMLAPQHSKLASLSSSSQNSLATPSISSGNSSVNVPEAYQPTRTQQTTPGPPEPMPTISSNGSTPKPFQAEAEEEEAEEDMPLFDAGVISAIQAIGHNGTIEKQQKQRPALNEGKRVMSTKEFDALQKKTKYRATFIQTAEPKSDSEDDYEDDEDDEATKLQKRRVEQQKKAQHILWRQKMVKDIGDHSSPLPPRPSYGRMSQSTPNVAMHTPKLSLSFSETPGSPGAAGESDDDEIPLGVLQAHGFPQRGTPPDASLNAQSYTGFQRPLSQAGPYARPGSPSGSVAGGSRGGALPPFARKLPQDPYLGQSSLNYGVSREALPYRAGSAPQQYAPMAAPPNGLVGVIADEETKRGMRRANPNAARQSVMLPQNMPMMQPGMPMMTPQGMMMMPNQMMMPQQQQMGMGIDVQQQFLHQMQAMQQQNAVLVDMIARMNEGGAPSMMNGMTGMGGMPQPGYAQSRVGPSRPVSIAQSGRAMSMLNLQLPDFSDHGRAMSMSNGVGQQWQNGNASRAPSVYGFPSGPGTNYAPSVAPSERSNIGQPSRYKPVQNAAMGDNMSVAGSSSTFLPPINTGSSVREGKKKSGFFSAIVHPPYRGKGKENAFKGIEEEDEDWSNFAQDRKAGAKV